MEKINHFSHEEHPLTLKELQADKNAGVVCFVCEEPIVGGSVYCCNDCKIFLHKSCAELPLEFMHHPAHPRHSLKLKARGMGRCNICLEYVYGFKYTCSKRGCYFNLDVKCAQKVEGILIHPMDELYPFILKELQQEDECEKLVCYSCEQPVLSGLAYFNNYLEIYIHKSCAKLPLEITHPNHPSDHPLKLLTPHPYSDEPELSVCNICQREWSGFTYRCFKCKFILDVFCAQLHDKLIEHPSHPHPLNFQQKTALFLCDACNIREEDQFYDCTECPFLIHKSCGSLPSKSLFKAAHPHPLSLAYSVPKEYRRYGLHCDICRKKLYPRHWVHYCAPCRYFVHLKCATSISQQVEANVYDENLANVIKLPADVVSSQVIKHFLKENCLQHIDQLSKEIKSFSHDHPLILANVEDDYWEMTDDDQETVCDACAEPISGSCYSCAQSQCNHFIHLDCIQLPTEITCDLHYPDEYEHKLFLGYNQEFFDPFSCEICCCYCNGFFYECKECESFKIDIKCALLPSTIKHEAHPHLLARDEGRMTFRCDGCSRENDDGDIYFECRTCEYKLEIGCATLPGSVRYRWDKHPYKLSFPPYFEHPDEFTCDECEEEIHPKFWLYHCGDRQLGCDNSFHPYCAPRFKDDYRNVKFGQKVQVYGAYHPHPLTFVRNVKYRAPCGNCHFSFYFLVFECQLCYFYLCRLCLPKLIGRRSVRRA